VAKRFWPVPLALIVVTIAFVVLAIVYSTNHHPRKAIGAVVLAVLSVIGAVLAAVRARRP
jgi:hypothetical protein